VVRKVLRSDSNNTALLLRDMVYDGEGNVKPTRLGALLNAALGYVSDQVEGFVDFDAVPEDGASTQVGGGAGGVGRCCDGHCFAL
jgi:aarF domain-containing kinase